jgi:hypothetical protein
MSPVPQVERWKLPPKVRIQVITPVTEIRQRNGQVLCPLHPSMPIGHGQKQEAWRSAVLAAGEISPFGIQPLCGILPTGLKELRFCGRKKREIELTQVVRTEEFFDPVRVSFLK